ncbi:MAG: FCD domain-containing protein [Desulfobacterales bacterium]|nr:FCD domain-containing protein [Desulfobacterales bacterium]
MPQTGNNLEFELLKRIIRIKEPVGASSLALNLNTSQATIGRKLHELEFQGFLEKKSNKGRVITSKGKDYFQQLENKELRKRRVDELINDSNVSSEKDLLDILYVRRLLEKEIAYLAAKNITTEDCKTLEKILSDQRLEIKYGSLGDQQDLEFHTMLGKISGNRILSQILSLIVTQSLAYLEFSYIRRQYTTAVDDHEKILKGLITKDPGLASSAMVKHIDKIIRDVKKYFANQPS